MDDFAIVGGVHVHQPEMTVVNVFLTQNLTLEPFTISFRRVLPEIQRLKSRIVGGENVDNVDEGHFRLVAMFASNTAQSSILIDLHLKFQSVLTRDILYSQELQKSIDNQSGNVEDVLNLCDTVRRDCDATTAASIAKSMDSLETRCSPFQL